MLLGWVGLIDGGFSLVFGRVLVFVLSTCGKVFFCGGTVAITAVSTRQGVLLLLPPIYCYS